MHMKPHYLFLGHHFIQCGMYTPLKYRNPKNVHPTPTPKQHNRPRLGYIHSFRLEREIRVWNNVRWPHALTKKLHSGSKSFQIVFEENNSRKQERKRCSSGSLTHTHTTHWYEATAAHSIQAECSIRRKVEEVGWGEREGKSRGRGVERSRNDKRGGIIWEGITYNGRGGGVILLLRSHKPFTLPYFI